CLLSQCGRSGSEFGHHREPPSSNPHNASGTAHTRCAPRQPLATAHRLAPVLTICWPAAPQPVGKSLADESGQEIPQQERTDSVPRLRHHWRGATRIGLAVLLFTAAQAFLGNKNSAHEGHDHDTPPALNLPVAPRVVAVTPDYELVGVLSGRDRLTIFLHRFETGEPVNNAKLTVSAGIDSDVEAVAKEDGVFEVAAPWLAGAQSIDILFKLTLPHDQDILTGRLERASTRGPATNRASSAPSQSLEVVYVGIGALMTGALAALLLRNLLGHRVARHRKQAAALDHADEECRQQAERASTTKRLHSVSLLLLLPMLPWLAIADALKAQDARKLQSVPATMATDAPQRMPDGSLFVPKATQHLLAIRTALTKESQTPHTVQLVGTVIADPNSFGRVQSGHSGRIEAPEGGLAFV